MLLSGGRSVSMLLTMTYLEVQRVQGLGTSHEALCLGVGVPPIPFFSRWGGRSNTLSKKIEMLRIKFLRISQDMIQLRY